MQKNYDYMFKFVIVGSSSVGKSSILKRFADDQFEESYISTIGIDFRFKSLYVRQNYVKLQIWDTAGQERFRGLTKSYYKGANAVIIVYDINNTKSFDDIMQFWLKQTRQFADGEHVFCFINKCDDGQDTPIPKNQLDFLLENKIEFFKVSAKKRVNVNQAILEITSQMMAVFPKTQPIKTQMSLKEVNNHPPVKKCCGK